MFTKISTQVVTKDQLIVILKSWDTDVKMPKSGEKSVICFPGIGEFVEVSIFKKNTDCDYKKVLYSIEFYVSNSKI